MFSLKKKESAWRLVAVFMKAYKWRTVIMLLALVFAGFAEGIGVATIMPIIETLSNSVSQEPSALGQTVNQYIEYFGMSPTIGTLLIFMVSAIFLKGILLLFGMVQTGYTIAQVTTDLRIRIINATLNAKWQYFIKHPIGTVANAISTEAQRAAQSYYAACLMAAKLIQITVYIFVAYLLNPELTILAVAVSPVIFLVFYPLVSKAKRAGTEQTNLQKRVLTWLTNGLQGIKPIKAMGREKFVAPLLEHDIQGLNTALRLQVFVVQTMKTMQEPFVMTGMAIVIYILTTTQEISFSVLAVLALVFYRIITQLTGLQQHYQTLVINQSAFWSLNNLASQAELYKEVFTGKEIVCLEKGIEFESVEVDIDDKKILEINNLTLPATGLVILVGPSGAGKTTLVDMLCGLVEPTKGKLLIDGDVIQNIDMKKWRDHVGYVPQEMILFHDTVRNNLTLGETIFTDKDIDLALTQACLINVIYALPEGLETILGERGSILSGGQRQRLAIARALLRKPKILIVDEVTTSLDPETEQEICKTLKVVSETALVLAISHQPAIQDIATQIVYLSNGQVINQEIKVAS